MTSSSADAPRRGRPGYDRDAVVRRAVELFDERGYEATSIADLAGSLGITKSAVFHHVGSKEELLAAALDEGLDALARAVDAAAHREDPDQSAHDRLRAVVAESVRILVDHLPAVRVLLRVRGNSDVERAALARRREIDHELARLVREAVEEGTLRSDLSPDLTSRLVFGTVNSLVEWVRPEGPLTRDELADAVTTMVFDGLTR